MAENNTITILFVSRARLRARDTELLANVHPCRARLPRSLIKCAMSFLFPPGGSVAHPADTLAPFASTLSTLIHFRSISANCVTHAARTGGRSSAETSAVYSSPPLHRPSSFCGSETCWPAPRLSDRQAQLRQARASQRGKIRSFLNVDFFHFWHKNPRECLVGGSTWFWEVPSTSCKVNLDQAKRWLASAPTAG